MPRATRRGPFDTRRAVEVWLPYGGRKWPRAVGFIDGIPSSSNVIVGGSEKRRANSVELRSIGRSSSSSFSTTKQPSSTPNESMRESRRGPAGADCGVGLSGFRATALSMSCRMEGRATSSFFVRPICSSVCGPRYHCCVITLSLRGKNLGESHRTTSIICFVRAGNEHTRLCESTCSTTHHERPHHSAAVRGSRKPRSDRRYLCIARDNTHSAVRRLADARPKRSARGASARRHHRSDRIAVDRREPARALVGHTQCHHRRLGPRVGGRAHQRCARLCHARRGVYCFYMPLPSG